MVKKDGYKHSDKYLGYHFLEAGDYRNTWRIFRIMAEFVEGYQFLSQFKKEVTILGSARFAPTSQYYKIAYDLGVLLAQNGYTVITGGGPGIMEAANKGAVDGGGESVGLNIQLPYEQRTNPYVKKSTAFYYFFTRKVMLTSPADAFVFFPGGFGTMDEFFEVVDDIELGKMCGVPVILVGKEYWEPLIEVLKQSCCAVGSLAAEQLAHWTIVDSAAEAMAAVKNKKLPSLFCELSPLNFHGLEDHVDWKIFRIMAELVEGFEFISGLRQAVTILGTRSVNPASPYYEAAYQLGHNLGENGFTVVTGGANGIGEASNKGALEAGAVSLGVGMEVHGKARINPYVTKSIIFKFPFTRKFVITAPTKAFVLFPGGFGTLHQLFEILTLMQTSKIRRLPVILFDHKFWEPLHLYIKRNFVNQFQTIASEDDEFYQIVDDVDSIVRIIQEQHR